MYVYSTLKQNFMPNVLAKIAVLWFVLVNLPKLNVAVTTSMPMPRYTTTTMNTSPLGLDINYLIQCYDDSKLGALTIDTIQDATPLPINTFLSQLGIGVSIDWYGFQCRIWERKGECNCGESCISTGTCCVDFLWKQYEFNKNMLTNVNDYVEKVKNSTKEQSCLEMFLYVPHMGFWSGYSYIMVDSCLPGANKTDVDGCSAKTELGDGKSKPVYGDDGYLYKNIHCARCNDVLRYRYDFMRLSCDWPSDHLKYLVDTFPFYEVLSRYSGCKMGGPKYGFENSIVRCQPNKCSPTDLMYCRLFIGTFFDDKDGFSSAKNVFCRKCQSSKKLQDGQVRRECIKKPDGWSMVINLNSGSDKGKCGQNEIEMSDGFCQSVQCGQGQRLVEGKCQHICSTGFTFSTAEKICKPIPCRKGFDRQSNGNCECITPKFINSTGHCQNCKTGYSYSAADRKCRLLPCDKNFHRQLNGKCECIAPKFIDYSTSGNCRLCESDSKPVGTGYGCKCKLGQDAVMSDHYNCSCISGFEQNHQENCSPTFCGMNVNSTPNCTCLELDINFNQNCFCSIAKHINSTRVQCRPNLCTANSSNGCPAMNKSQPGVDKNITTAIPITTNQANTTSNTMKPRAEQQQSFDCLDQVRQALTLFVFLNKTTNENISNMTQYVQLFNVLNANWKVSHANKTMLVLRSTDFQSDPRWKNNLLQETLYNQHLVKAVINTLSLSQNQIISSQYGFDLTRTFSNYKLCGKYKTSIIAKVNGTCNMTMINDNVFSSQIIITIRNGTVAEEMIHCKAFHLHSRCLRQTIFPTGHHIFENGSLVIQRASTERKTYRIDEYFPLANGFQTCVYPVSDTNSRSQYWTPAVKKAKYHISVIGTCFSLFSYLLFLGIFAAISGLRNTGSFYIIVLVCFLLLSDAIFLANFHLRKGSISCTWIFMLLYWSLLNVLIWSALVAIDMMLQFTKTSLSISDRNEAIKTLQKRLTATLLVSLVICGVLFTLKESGLVAFELDSKYCWFGNWYWSLGFYFIPAMIEYLLCLLCLCVLLRSISMKRNEAQRTLGRSNQKDIGLLKVGIKLMLILGVTEILGLVQIRGSRLDEKERVFNAVFGLIYDVLRSFRGVFIFVFYTMNQKTKATLKQHFFGNKKKDSRYELSNYNKTKSTSISVN